MALFDTIRAGASGAADSAYEISKSVRFDRGSSPYFSRTPSSAGNRDTWTLSCWVKKSENELYQAILYAGPSTGTNHNNTDAFAFTGSDQLFFGGEVGQSVTYNIVTNRKFRDVSAWYHIVLAVDTTQGTASDRVKLYINGVQETSFGTETYMSQNQDTFVNATNIHAIGYTSSGRTIEGYFAEYYLIDGQQLTPSSFGETDATTGEWNPKNSDDVKDNVTFGTNGFYLNFSDNSSNAAIGTDYSGNSNTWTVNNISSSHDIVPDTPTNNFCTGNYIGRRFNGAVGYNATYSEGSLEIETGGNATHAYGTIAVNQFLTSGCYFEVLIDDLDTSRTYVGIVDPDSSQGSASYAFTNKAMVRHSFHVYGSTAIDGTSDYDAAVSDCVAGDIIGVAIKGTSIWFHKNGTYINNSSGSTGNPSTGANAAITAITDIATQHYLPYAGYNSDFTWNFGQDSSFAGAKTAQGNTDAGGIGDFYYPVPTGFKAICIKNMPDPSIKLPNKHFDSLLYSGNGAASRAITGLDFAPDWVWIKSRNQTYYHQSFDSVRGVAAGTLFVNVTLAENTSYVLDSLDSNGFTTSSDTSDEQNANSVNYVAWNWNAGDTDSKTYTVTVVDDSGNKYRFDGFGTSAVTLDLVEGGTYIFNYPSAHPFKFSTTSDGTHGGGSEYTTGVTHNSSTQVTIVVAASAPTLYYYCSSHSGMGGQVNTNSTKGSSNFDGSIQSKVKANATAGFSVITYSGTKSSAGSDTIGHGLGAAARLIIIKRRNSTHGWSLATGARGYSSGQILSLDDLYANPYSYNDYGATPTSSVFTVSYSSRTNISGGNHVAYCFSEVAGFSKFGKYTSNSEDDGPYIQLGFTPALFIIKGIDSDSDWVMWDNKRDTMNPRDSILQPSNADQDYSSGVDVDFLSNGVKLRSGSGYFNHPAGYAFIYIAFAEIPFKYARGV